MRTSLWNPDPRFNGAQGFTLIEMLVVLAIMALTLSLVMVMRPKSVTESSGTRIELGRTLKAAREHAIASGKAVAPELGEGASFRAFTRSQNSKLIFYPDGSAVDGTVLIGRTPAFTVRWLDGLVETVDVAGS